jgi:hypothetical protein
VDLIRARLQNNLVTWVWSEGAIDSYEEWSPELNKFFNDPESYTIQSLSNTPGKSIDLNAMMAMAPQGTATQATQQGDDSYEPPMACTTPAQRTAPPVIQGNSEGVLDINAMMSRSSQRAVAVESARGEV